MIDTARTWRESPVAQAVRNLRDIARRAGPRGGVLESWANRLWWPLEAGNDLRALYARGTDRAYPSYVPDRAANELAITLRTIQRRIQIQRALTLIGRTTWLALLATMALLLLGLVVPVPTVAIVGTITAIALFAWIYHRRHPVTVWTTARLLDRHAHLDEQLSTALELAVNHAPVRLASRQMVAAHVTMKELEKTRRFWPRVPNAELQMAVSLGVLVAGLTLMAGPIERLAPPRDLAAPDALNADMMANIDISDPEMLAMLQTSQGALGAEYENFDPAGIDSNMDFAGVDSEALRQASELSNRSAKELEALAEALKDASVTAQAAQDIQAGNYEAAAQQIADLSKSLESLSPQARADLAERLRQASETMQAMDPELARRIEQASKALASRNDRAAAQGLEDLSKAVSETGKNVMSQQQLAEALERMAESSSPVNDDGPGRSDASQAGQAGDPGMLGEGEAGEFGFGQSASSLQLPITAGAAALDDGSGGSGAGRGQGSAAEEYEARLSPDQQRIVAPVDQAPGPTAPRLGQPQPGAPEVVTAGPGTTGPGAAPQGGLPITTGLDANRVPRGLRSVVEGYFKNQKDAK